MTPHKMTSTLQSRQVQTTIVNLNCPVPVEKWKMARAALILDPG